MFFPQLSRQATANYHSNRGTFYADYGANYENIVKDCQGRCTYCDVTLEEHGGDEMQLDHFRPQKYFSSLKTHPHNLYLACAKCNGLKKDDWPAVRQGNHPPFVGKVGYIDRFAVNVDTYMMVGTDGVIVPLSDPAAYLIKRLHLNRTSRVNVRRKRQLFAKKTQLLKDIAVLMTAISQDRKANKISKDQALEKYDMVGVLVDSLQSLN